MCNKFENNFHLSKCLFARKFVSSEDPDELSIQQLIEQISKCDGIEKIEREKERKASNLR